VFVGTGNGPAFFSGALGAGSVVALSVPGQHNPHDEDEDEDD
jgi:hypothetical protein